MTKPVYKIEVWEPGGGSALHSITSDVSSIYTKESITKGVGNFSFTVPTKKNGGYYYNDIDPFDKVKIWLGYDGISGNPDYIGRVLKISAPLSTQTGYIRVISGLSQGEILLRRNKTNKWYSATGASSIVTDFANDLSLGTGQIASDTTQVDLNIDTTTYFELLKYVSDYWYDAVTKVQKDFYIDINNNLVWKARPLRTIGVESFSIGTDIVHYNVIHQITPIKNTITVYGEREKVTPSDKDLAEATSGWSGPNVTQQSDRRIGSYSIQTKQTGGSTSIWVEYYNASMNVPCDRWKKHQYLNFWLKPHLPSGGNITQMLVEVTDSAGNFFYDYWWSLWDTLPPTDVWTEYKLPLGDGYGWNITGSPSWDAISGFEVHLDWALLQSNATLNIDGGYFGKARYVGTALDATSQTNYGQRDLEIIDEKLTSDNDCSQRAEALLMQKKDVVTEIVLTVRGNTNVLVGDRLSMTIPAEGISAANYDVISVEHFMGKQLGYGFLTRAIMVNSANIRKPLPLSVVDSLVEAKQNIKELGRNEQSVG